VREVPSIRDVDVRRRSSTRSRYPADHLRRAAPIGTWTPAGKAEEVTGSQRRAEGAVRQVFPTSRGLRRRGAAHRAGCRARESERAIKELGACGVQIVTNVNGKALDQPEFVAVL